MYRDFGTIISKHVGVFGYDVVRTYCGHGVGELFHCAPNIPHYNGIVVSRFVCKRYLFSRCNSFGFIFVASLSFFAWSGNKAIGKCKPGTIFTIEPMINLGKYKDVLWPDDWTAVAEDGTVIRRFSPRHQQLPIL
jgi:methionyl aminopeptidase